MTDKQRQTISLYRSLMEEVNVRTKAIENTANGLTRLDDRLALEFCFLQLRMLCEVLALACLAARGDIKEAWTAGMQKKYSPATIFSQLEALHSNFYPGPVTQQRRTGAGKVRMHMTDATGAFLAKADIVKLWGQCGDVLHRGGIKRLLSPNDRKPPNFDGVVASAGRFIELLGVHTIVLFDGRILICGLRSERDGGVVVQLATPT